MQITLARLDGAVAAMRSDFSRRPADERRLLPRYRVWAPAMIVPCDAAGSKAAASFEVWILDLSRGGLGFMSSRPLKVGQFFRFTLPSSERSVPPLHTISEVVYCSPAAAGSHTVGARFVAPLAAQAEQPRGAA